MLSSFRKFSILCYTRVSLNRPFSSNDVMGGFNGIITMTSNVMGEVSELRPIDAVALFGSKFEIHRLSPPIVSIVNLWCLVL